MTEDSSHEILARVEMSIRDFTDAEVAAAEGRQRLEIAHQMRLERVRHLREEVEAIHHPTLIGVLRHLYWQQPGVSSKVLAEAGGLTIRLPIGLAQRRGLRASVRDAQGGAREGSREGHTCHRWLFRCSRQEACPVRRRRGGRVRLMRSMPGPASSAARCAASRGIPLSRRPRTALPGRSGVGDGLSGVAEAVADGDLVQPYLAGAEEGGAAG
ncbi:hypothetical protein [Streptomyces sp. NPDC055036]